MYTVWYVWYVYCMVMLVCTLYDDVGVYVLYGGDVGVCTLYGDIGVCTLYSDVGVCTQT